MGDGPGAVEYVVDADGLVVGTNRAWDAAAREAGAAELAAPAPGLNVWSAIRDDATRALWRTLVERARERGGLRVPFRCDTAVARRWFELDLLPGTGGSVRFRSVVVREERRDRVALLDPPSGPPAPDRPLLLMCSWCARFRDGDEWVEVEDLLRRDRSLARGTPPRLSHGICDRCRAELLEPRAPVG